MSSQSHIRTPLLYSPLLSQKTGGHNVYLKLESFQPSGSFKIRGVGRSVQAAHAKIGAKLRVITSSGGNAGLAASTASRIIGVPCTVYCPETTPDHMVELFKAEGATVVRQGKAWDDANAMAEAAVAEDPDNAVLVHPFAGEELVKGNATLMEEVYEQLRSEHGLEPETELDLVSCVVGGGGLINGVLTGILGQERKSQSISSSPSTFRRPTVIATQCFGADAFSRSWLQHELVTLPAISSRATSMGAKQCSAAALATAEEYGRERLISLVTDDGLAASCSFQFAQDHLLLVEVSCGAGLVPAYYSDRLPMLLQGSGDRKKNIVIIVCGGRKDRIQDIFAYGEEVATARSLPMDLNGKRV
ncbi:tryptophan synthase beta subunit-like PLP-dependent enzyme [Microstroma glucosiphilum]|uniref:L-serine ammonia-lyase n=1 Tax=Pseudomicrostroma glucosiphilum TaxID=1684307 RepID=A0A316UG90_9BASI|nr:tryptophan synthase beta subunit-like PLP-dependent enzyme [Pseudomicrostroma glucosiphilum]PWN23958.1 tryptophan synthase beta subunit-like PLP-dependent enzyme [Pseudomicrostroma glucosiphilum]